MSSGTPDPGLWSTARNTARAFWTIPPFIALHGWRSRHVERRNADVDEFSETLPAHVPHPRLQRRDDGVGPIVMRTYLVDIAEPALTPTELMSAFRVDPNHFNSNLVAGFVKNDAPARNLSAGDEFVVELPGPWNGPVVVQHCDDESTLLATLDGHMEAGHIRFDSTTNQSTGADTGTQTCEGYAFRIRSWAGAGDAGFAAVHLGVPIGKEMQTAMWTAMCDRAVAIAGGHRNGPISVVTEQLVATEAS